MIPALYLLTAIPLCQLSQVTKDECVESTSIPQVATSVQHPTIRHGDYGMSRRVKSCCYKKVIRKKFTQLLSKTTVLWSAQGAPLPFRLCSIIS